MPVPSTIHAQEITRIAQASYINNTFKALLVDSPGSDFDADDAFATITAGEVTAGLGGYSRQSIGFVSADLGSYDGERLELSRKAATFTHNGSLNEIIRFSHVVLIDPSETQVVAVTKLASRATLSDQQTAIFYFDFSLYGVFVVQ